MKKTRMIIAALLILVMIFAVTGCGSKENSLTGTWEYKDPDADMGAVYVFKIDGTGTYTMDVGGQSVTYEMKYEAKDGHLYITFVNNEVFSEDDVFDSEYSFKDAKTLIVNDSFGEQLTFKKK